MKDQFTPKRMAGLAVLFLLMFIWMCFMQFDIGVTGGDFALPDGAWDPYILEAILFAIFVIVVDVVVTMLTLRKAKARQGALDAASRPTAPPPRPGAEPAEMQGRS